MNWKVFALASCVLAASAIAVNAFAPRPAGHREQVIKFVEEVWTKGNVAYIDQAMHPDFVRYGHTAEGTTVGIPAFKEHVRKIRSAFTDYSVTLLDMMGDGDKATFTWQLRGNYVGEDKKITPGRKVELTGKTVWFFRGDKVLREVVDLDDAEYHRQIAMALPYSEVENRALMLSFLYEVFQEGNLSAMNEVLASDHILHDPDRASAVGADAYRERLQALRDGFPDLTFIVHDIIADGDLVTTRWTMAGTHRGEWGGIAPTGKRMVVAGLTFARMKDNKIQETWNIFDRLGVREQITAK